MKPFTLALIFFTAPMVCSQSIAESYLLKSMITSVGSSTVSDNKNFSVQQSIGQSSIIGTKNVKNISIQQGFLNHFINFKIDNSIETIIDRDIKFVISPNPFIDHVKIDFSVFTDEDIFIKVYDINGKVFLIQKFPPSSSIIIPLPRLGIGNYLINIKTGSLGSTKKILKTQ